MAYYAMLEVKLFKMLEVEQCATGIFEWFGVVDRHLSSHKAISPPREDGQSDQGYILIV